MIVVGRHHRDAPEAAHGARKRLNAGGSVTVVVRYENVHGFEPFESADRVPFLHDDAPEVGPGKRGRSLWKVFVILTEPSSSGGARSPTVTDRYDF